jgi:hypothetical protein
MFCRGLARPHWREIQWKCVVEGLVVCAEISSSFFQAEVIGNFTKGNARAFFDRMRPAAGLAAINQEEWEDIYEVTLLVCCIVTWLDNHASVNFARQCTFWRESLCCMPALGNGWQTV